MTFLSEQEDYAQVLVKGIELIGEKLKDFFPWQDDDVNELADGVYDEDK